MKLANLDFSEDVKKYDAKEIKADVHFVACNHRNAQINDLRTELRCPCGLAWTGSRLQELKLLLDKRN